jgi:hypothetical protein
MPGNAGSSKVFSEADLREDGLSTWVFYQSDRLQFCRTRQIPDFDFEYVSEER